MTIARLIAAFGLALIISACADFETPTRNAGFDAPSKSEPLAAGGAKVGASVAGSLPLASAVSPLQEGKSPVRVQSVRVRVPRTLVVSEANSFLPRGDIVWREDPVGDRYEQVRKIVQDALSGGVKSLNGPVPVVVDVEVVKFHALTEKARYTTGGVHAITFNMAIRDANTGELLVPARQVRADLVAYGGTQALRAEAQGLTQKVRISNHLKEVIRQELTSPGGYQNATKGFIQSINYI